MHTGRCGIVGVGAVSGGLPERQGIRKQLYPVEIQGKGTGSVSRMGYVYIGLVCVDIRCFFTGKQVYGEKQEDQGSWPAPENASELVQNHEFARINLILPFESMKVAKQGYLSIYLTF